MNPPVNEATVEALPEARRLSVFVSTGKRPGGVFPPLPAVPLPQIASTDDSAVQPRKDPIEPTGKARKPSSPPIAARPPCCSSRSHSASRRPSDRRAAPPAEIRRRLAPDTTRPAGLTQSPDATKSPVPDAAPVRTDAPAAPSPDPAPNTTESSAPIAPDPSPEPSPAWRP